MLLGFFTMRFKGFSTVPSVLVLVLVILQSTDARQCNINCAGTTGNILKFQPGKTYQYRLEGSSITTLPGSKKDVSKTDIEANIEVSATSGCEHVLTVSGVKTRAPDESVHSLDSKLGSNPIKFGLQNGKITELCTLENEADSAINIKRAILSLLQSAVLKDSGNTVQHETDVFGSCPTNFEFSKQGSSVIVRKSRDLTKCAHREQLNPPISTSTYFVKSEIQTSPLLEGSFNSEQRFEGGVLKSASSEESYNYNPMSSIESTTKIHVKTKLILTGQIDKPAPAVNANKGTSIIFQAQHDESYKGGVETMLGLLRASCDTKTVDSEVASKFNQLVRTIADAPKEDLQKVYQQVKAGQGFKEKDVAKKMFMDGLAAAGSSGSVEILAELLKNKEIPEAKAPYFHMLLGLVKHATRDALKAVQPLLDEAATPELYLSAGTLGGRFCKEHNCGKFPEVEAFQLKLADPLITKGFKPATTKEQDILIGSLKGLANMRYLTKPVVAKLVENVADNQVLTRIRVAILETMRSDANKSEMKKVVADIFANPEEDAEIRIKAYLVLAESPCGKIVTLVKSVLEKDKSFQVGGFVVSHLRNLRASTNPEKANAKHLLGPIIGSNKFPVDIRKYSQNNELSYHVDMLNYGAAGESNVIYSQKSYIPRSVSLNLTSFMFGHSFNWLDVDLRMENVDRALERLLGPKGLLRKKKINDVYDDLRESGTAVLETAAERYEKTLRQKRSTASRDQLNTLASKVKLNPGSSDDVDIDLSLRMYGAERVWLRYHGDKNGINAQRAVDKFFGGVEDTMKTARNLNYDYRKQMPFMDRDISYPTGLGLPLKVRVVGSLAYRVQLDGKVDVAAVAKDPSNANLRLQVVPSAAIELRGDLLVGGVAFEGGVKVSLNVHTSTGSDITLRVLDGHGVDVKFGLPIKKQEIISINTDIKTIIKQDNTPEKTIPIAFDTKREKYSGCFDQLSEVLGLTVCGEVDVPWEGPRSLSPAYGPSKLTLHVDKDDDLLTQYHFKVYSKDSEGVQSYEVLFDTPGSRVNRKVLLLLEGSNADKHYGKISLTSPWTNMLMEAALIYTQKELSLNAKFSHDDVEYSFKTGATKQQQGNAIRFEPVLEYKAPEQTKSALVGRRGGPKPTDQLVTLSGAVIVESNDNGKTWKYESLALNTARTKYSIDGTGKSNKQGGEIDVVVHYDKENVKVKGQYQQNPKQVSTQLSVIPSQYPDLSTNIKWDTLKDVENGKYESTLTAIHGPDPNSATNKIYLHNLLEFNRKQGIYATENTLQYPVVNLEVHLGLRSTPKSLKTDLKGKFDRYSAQLLAKGDINAKKDGDYNAEVKGELMGNTVSLSMSRSVLKNHQSKFSNALEINPGGRYELNVQARHKLNEKDIDVSADVDLILPVDPKNIKVKTGLKHNEVETKGHFNAVAGAKQYVKGDFNVKISDKPSGGFKLNVLENINANGDYSFDGNNVKAKAKIDLPKAQRQMEAKANFAVSKSKLSGSADVCWDTKNPEKTLKIQTDTSFNDDSIDSKNTVSLGGKDIIANIKGKCTGEEEKGSTAGDVELKLADGTRLLVKVSESRDLTNQKNIHGEGLLELEAQIGGQQHPFKTSLKLVGKNIDMENMNFDVQISQNVITAEKSDLISHVILKKVPKGDNKMLLKGEYSSSGSLAPNPVTLKVEADVPAAFFDDDSSLELDSLPPATGRLSLVSGSDIQLDSNAKIGGNTIAVDLSAKLAKGPITSLKWTTSNVIDIKNDDKRKIKSNNELHWNSDNFIKVNGEANCEPNGLSYSAEWETNKVPKRKLTGSAHWTNDASARKADANTALSWEGKTADLNVQLESNNDNVNSIHLSGHTPEKGKFELQANNKMVKNGQGSHSNVVLTMKDKKIALSSKIELVENHPLIDLVLDQPEGKSRFYWKVDVKGERHILSELKVKWTGEKSGSLNVDSEVIAKSIENFSVKHNIDAPQVGVRKVQIELSNKPGRGDGKKLVYLIKEDEKIKVSASSNYILRKDGDEYVIEGNGKIKVMDEPDEPLSFKGSWINTDKEKGMKLNVKSKSRSFDMNFRHDDDELNIERTMCDQGKCTKMQILNRVRAKGLEEYEQTAILKLDLSILRSNLKDVYYEAKYKRKGQNIDHLIEAKYNEKTKFKYNAYIHDKEAAILLTLPQRTIGADIMFDVTKQGKSGLIKLESNLYLNKEQNRALTFKSLHKMESVNNQMKLESDTSLRTYHENRKPHSIKGHVVITDNKDIKGEIVIDLQDKESAKMVIDFKSTNSEKPYRSHSMLSIKSKECSKLNIHVENDLTISEEQGSINWQHKLDYVTLEGAKKSAVGKYQLDSKKQYLLIKLAEVKLVEMNMKFDSNDKELTVTADYTLGTKNFNEKLVYNKDENLAKYSLKWDNHHIDASLGILMTKAATWCVKLDGKTAAEVSIALDEQNFLKSDYKYDPDVIKNSLQALSDTLNFQQENFGTLVKQSLQEERRQISHIYSCVEDGIRDMGDITHELKKAMITVKDELMSDEDLAQPLKRLAEGFGTVFEHITAILDDLHKLFSTTQQLVGELAHNIAGVIESSWPKVSESLDKLIDVLVKMIEENVRVMAKLSEQILDELKKNKEDIDAYVKEFSELIHEVGKQIAGLVHGLHAEIQKFIQINIEQLKELPITNMLKEKYEELKELRIPEEALMVYQEVVENLKQFLPTPEAENFITALSDYISKILKQEPVDGAAASQELYDKLVSAIKSLISKLNEITPKQDVFKPEKYITLPVTSWLRIPAGSVRVSVIELLRSQDFPILLGSIETFALSLNPLDNIPPFQGIAQIIDSTEIITFDNRHYHVKGLCAYVLAEDYVNRNFSIVGHFKDGKLEAITTWDENHSITLRQNDAPLKDGKEAEYPLRAGSLKAWITPYTVGLRSKAGVIVKCTPLFDSCTFTVSGFYFNKLRGLLGNLNYEQFDDLYLPQGTVGSDPAQVCNSWKVDNSCPDVPVTPHQHQRQRLCTDMFASDDSDLILGRPWLTLAPYRDACDHLVETASDKDKAACRVAKSYVYHAQKKGAYLLEVPSECAICEINNKKINEDEDVEITPGKLADIVILVDVLKKNEDTYKKLVQPLVPKLKAQLAKSGVSDVRVVLASYNSPTNKWTNYHSVDGKLQFNGPDCVIEFEEKPAFRNVTWVDRLINDKHQIDDVLGNTPQMRAYEDVLESFNFRPNALKSIIGVHSAACESESSLSLIIAIRSFFNAFVARDGGVTWNIITPINSLATDNKVNFISNDIVAFGSSNIYSLDKGTAQSDADYEADFCIPGALATGGVIVPVYNFEDSQKLGKSDAFLQKAAGLLVEAIERNKAPLQCECNLIHGLEPKPECELEDF